MSLRGAKLVSFRTGRVWLWCTVHSQGSLGYARVPAVIRTVHRMAHAATRSL